MVRGFSSGFRGCKGLGIWGLGPLFFLGGRAGGGGGGGWGLRGFRRGFEAWSVDCGAGGLESTKKKSGLRFRAWGVLVSNPHLLKPSLGALLAEQVYKVFPSSNPQKPT